ncbi:MAG: TetR/AcrR family transcriptional regulator [Phycisphaerae bacterium]
MISQRPEQMFEPSERAAPANRSTDGRETYDERLNHILEAATEVIAREGYQKASMRRVAKAARASLAGLYHYFDSKEKMLFLIQFRTFTALLNNLREKLHGVRDPVERLRVMVRSHVDYFAANMAALKTCSQELDSLTTAAYDEIRKIRHDYYGLTRSVVEGAVDAHVPGSTLDPHVATMSLFGTLNWLYRWYHPKRDCSPSVLANQIAGQFLHGVLGENRGRTSQHGREPSGMRQTIDD